MDANLDYLHKLGYSEQEIEAYSKEWAKEIISYLADNSANVVENMRLLQKDFSRDLLLKFSVFYSDAFTLNPEMFSERISLLKQAFPDEWTDIMLEEHEDENFHWFSVVPLDIGMIVLEDV